MEIITQLFFRTIILYAAILFIFRIMGKREVGELSVLDLIVFMMLGDLAVLAIDNSDHQALLKALLPMAVLLLIQLSFAWFSLKSKRFRTVIDGVPAVIINKGKIDEKVMKQQRYNFDDLMAQLRSQNVFSVQDVEYAILETSGELSILEKKMVQKPGMNAPFPLIMDGEIQPEALKQINKDEKWLHEKLKKLGWEGAQHISLCVYMDGKLLIDEKNH